jgi:hypothetical protein
MADEIEEVEEIEDLDKYEEELEKQRLEEQERIVNEFVNAKDAHRVRVMKNLNEVDQMLRTALSLILNYYAEQGQFNQQLLEDTIPLIAQRKSLLRKIK